MTVKDLKVILAQYPDDMPVIYDRQSDYNDLPEPAVVRAIFRPGQDYVEKYFAKQWEYLYEEKDGRPLALTQEASNRKNLRGGVVRECLHFAGN